MTIRHTFPECCITCQHRQVDENESTCVIYNSVDLKNKINQVLTVCSHYEPSWRIQNIYRNKLGLPELPTNYYPYGERGKEARLKLIEALESDESLTLKAQMEIFIESQRD